MSYEPLEPSTIELPPLQAIEVELASRSLPDFIRQAWPVIEPGTEYLHNWHIDAICEHLAAVDAGEITRLLINIPPRYMKSICVSVMWPTWSWIRNPASRWMFASYSQNLSTKHSVDRRTIIESDWYRRAWGERVQLTGDQNVKTEYMNTERGVMFATSIDGTATGKGGNRLVLDDPHDAKGVESDVRLEHTITTIERKLSSRLNDKKRDAIVIVMQRVREKDASSWALAQGDYVHLCLPAVAESRTIVSLRNGLEIVREQGDLLWPEREGKREIEQAKRQLGSYGYACQYQQSPAPLGGGKFKSAWFRFYEVVGEYYKLYRADGQFKTVRIDDCSRIGFVDPAGTEKQKDNKPCYTVIGVWDLTPQGDLIKVAHIREQMETPEAANRIVEVSRVYGLSWVGIEKDGIGLGIVQNARRRGVTVRAIKAKGSKEARSETAEIRMEAGTIYLPANAPWLFDLESELTKFPNSEFKDQVDELSYAALWAQRSAGAPTLEEDTVYHDSVEAAQIAKEQHGEYVVERETQEQALVSARAARSGESDDAWVRFNGDEDDNF
jgi:predicted phage terminase large subunit-like protein